MDRFNTFKLFMETNKNKIIVIIIGIAILFLSSIMFLNIDKRVNTKTNSLSFSNLELKSSNDVKEEDNNDDYYIVDIKGEIKIPGIYSLEKNKRVYDVINQAGGLTENADTSLLNQSIKIKDQMVIIIYSKDEIANIDKLKETEKKKEEICQKEIRNDACIYNNSETMVIPDIQNKQILNNEDLKENNAKNNLEDNNQKININTASLDLLMTIPKIGKVKASAIITYRNSNGNFNSIEDIKNVNGIGDSLFETIKDYISV